MGNSWTRRRGRPVRNRRFDRLAKLDPYDFERVVADYYRSQGYEVDHCGGRGRYDGGIDLKMYRGGEYTVVQCKRENASQVRHNVVHELLGVMLTEKADRAVVVNTGEFSPHAIKSAANEPRLELIDGDRLREMLPEYAQPVPEPEPVDDDDKYVFSVPVKDRPPPPEPMVMTRTKSPFWKAKPSRPAAPDRELRNRPSRRRGRQPEATRAIMALAMLAGVLVWQCSKEPPQPKSSSIGGSSKAVPVRPVQHTRPVDSRPGSAAVSRSQRPSPAPVVSEPLRAKRTPEESRRRANEAMRILAPNTPEFEPLPGTRARSGEE